MKILGIDKDIWASGPSIGLRMLKADIEFEMTKLKCKSSRASRVAEGNEDNNKKGKTSSNKAATNTKTDRAEKEHPSEKAGAEKNSGTVVNEVGAAAMAGGGHIKDKDPNVLDFSMFGVQMETGPANDPAVTPSFEGMVNGYKPPFDPSMMHPNYGPAAPQGVAMPMQAGQMYAQPGTIVTPPPIAGPGGAIPMGAPSMGQPIVDPNAQKAMTPEEAKYAADMQAYEQKKQDAEKIQKGKGNHKVDNPVPPKPPKVKAEADNVNVDLDAINVATNPPKPPKEWPEVVANPLPHAEVQPEPAHPKFDNSALCNKYRYLADIENIALANGVDVQFLQRVGFDGQPNGLISCVSYTGQPEPNPYKGFTIDTGVIIDKRAKVYPGIVQSGYEEMQAYPVLIPKPDETGKGKSKNVINEQLFNDIFKGGVEMLSPKGLYSPEFRNLNMNVDLITMPTGNMNKDTRKMVQDRLMAAMKAGVFDAARQHDANSRFAFKAYDKKTNCFTLTNVNVPFRYGGQCLATRGVEIHFGIDETKVVTLS